ncbi:MAG: glycosyltransferase family 4 protein [Rhizobiaceae bacterium]|nr:glycosyltransferase family 4 protein [Rhizobiaceae bacterium]
MQPETRLRIVHCFRAPVGGVFRHVRDLAEEQTASGHAVGFVCDSTTGGDYEAKLFAEVEPRLALGVTRIPMQRQIGLGDLGAALRTHRVLKALAPDVLHGHGAKGGLYARLFGTALRRSKPVGRYYSPHGGSLHFDERSLKGKSFFAVERWLERMTDGLFFVCDYERAAYVRKVGPVRTASCIAYNGLRDEEFIPVEPVREASDLLFIGTLRQLKGPDLFIEAIASAQRSLERKLTAVIVGDGEWEATCKALVEARGLGGQIEFRPAMPARAAFALARTVVIPSRAESFPYIVLEALAAGRPVIATKVGGIPEIMGADCPALVDPDSDSLSQRLVAFANDPDLLANAMPDEAELKQRFSLGSMARTIMTAYTQKR